MFCLVGVGLIGALGCGWARCDGVAGGVVAGGVVVATSEFVAGLFDSVDEES